MDAPRATNSIVVATAHVCASSRPTRTEDLHGAGLHGGSGREQHADERSGQRHQAHGPGLVEARQQSIRGGRSDHLHPGVPRAQPQAECGFHLSPALLDRVESRLAASAVAVIALPRTMPPIGTSATPSSGTTPLTSMRGNQQPDPTANADPATRRPARPRAPRRGERRRHEHHCEYQQRRPKVRERAARISDTRPVAARHAPPPTARSAGCRVRRSDTRRRPGPP